MDTPQHPDHHPDLDDVAQAIDEAKGADDHLRDVAPSSLLGDHDGDGDNPDNDGAFDSDGAPGAPDDDAKSEPDATEPATTTPPSASAPGAP